MTAARAMSLGLNAADPALVYSDSVRSLPGRKKLADTARVLGVKQKCSNKEIIDQILADTRAAAAAEHHTK